MEKLLMWWQEKKNICLIVFFVLLSGAFLSLYLVEVTAEEAFVCPKTEIKTEEDLLELESKAEFVTVDIKGAVVNPGVYKVSVNSIVNDVIVQAGGLTKEADTSNLNLSKLVSNEMVITVFTKTEIETTKKESIKEESKTSEDKEKPKLISLNKATLEELLTLPGVGEAKAKLIIQYRENCGPFINKEELKNIKGIGESVYEKLAAFITI